MVQAALTRFPLRGKPVRCVVPPLPMKPEDGFAGVPLICGALEGLSLFYD